MPDAPPDDDIRGEANRLIAYHSPISRALTAERSTLESGLIPVTAYIVVACVEAWWRYPDIVRTIEAAMPAGEVGRCGRRPGSRINSVHLWTVANLPLVGRKVMAMVTPDDDPPARIHPVLRFWEQAALAFRGDGHRQAWDAGGTVRPYDDDVVAQLVDGAVPVDDALRGRIKRFNATLVSYLFLLYFDTRVGVGNTGPWPLPDGRTLLVRDYYRMGHSDDYWWSDVAAGMPFHNLTAAFVLDGVDVRITDFGTADTDPADYLDRLVSFSLFTTDTPDGSLRPVELDALDEVTAAARAAQAQHYRNVAAMGHHEKIRCGAHVYFSFLRPFAEAAGVADDVDWTVPRDLPPPLYELFAAMRGGEGGDDDPSVPYYAPLTEA